MVSEVVRHMILRDVSGPSHIHPSWLIASDARTRTSISCPHPSSVPPIHAHVLAHTHPCLCLIRKRPLAGRRKARSMAYDWVVVGNVSPPFAGLPTMTQSYQTRPITCFGPARTSKPQYGVQSIFTAGVFSLQSFSHYAENMECCSM